MKRYGKEIWESKIKTQTPEQVVGGSLANEKNLKKSLESSMQFLDKNILPLIRKNGKIADIGVGPMARFSIEFSKRGYNVVGIDVSATTIKHAKNYINKSGMNKKIKLILQDMIKINLREKVDLVFCWGTFYHLPPYLSLDVLKRFNKILKKGGYALIDFSLKGEEYTLKRHLFDLIWFIGHSIKKIRKKDFYVTVTKFTKKEIEDMLKLSDFDIIKNWEGYYLLRKIS